MLVDISFTHQSKHELASVRFTLLKSLDLIEGHNELKWSLLDSKYSFSLPVKKLKKCFLMVLRNSEAVSMMCTVKRSVIAINFSSASMTQSGLQLSVV